MTFLRIHTRVFGLLGPEARVGWFLAVANVALAVAQFADPMLLGRIVDALVGASAKGMLPAWTELVPLLSAWAGVGLFTIGCGILVALYADRLAHRRRHAALIGYFEHVLQLPLSDPRGHVRHLMTVMVGGADALWGLWLAFFREHLSALVLIAVLLPLSLLVNWRLALLLIGLSIFFALLTAIVLRRTRTRQAAVEREYSDLAEQSADVLGNVALVRSFARIEVEVSGLQDVVGRLLSAQMPVLSWWAVVVLLTRISTTLTLMAILLAGVLLFLERQATIGEIVGFMSFAAVLIGRLQHLVGYFDRVKRDTPLLREFFGTFDSGLVRDRPDPIDPGRVRGLVEFKDVSFSYDGKRPAVADLSFTALPGETVAIVGRKGAGKSTVLALLHRAFDPQSGMIMIDGMDIRGVSLAGLRRAIGVVFQEPLLFDRSIADNLRVGKPDATDAELRAACERALALDIIERRHEGIDARVGHCGHLLSHSERQRLAIARVLLKDPPILILDDATSALDAATESQVLTALNEAMKGRTTFIIAHRLATVRNASRILVIEGGRVIETGTFDELIKRGGHFAALARTQFAVPEARPAKAPEHPESSGAGATTET